MGRTKRLGTCTQRAQGKDRTRRERTKCTTRPPKEKTRRMATLQPMQEISRREQHFMEEEERTTD